MAKLTGFVFMLLLLTAQPLIAQGFWYELAGAVGGATFVIVGAPLALGAAGFTAGGIAAGTVAAKMMSVVYATNTGLAALSVLQSTGAAGVATSTILAGGLAGAGAGHYAGSHSEKDQD